MNQLDLAWAAGLFDGEGCGIQENEEIQLLNMIYYEMKELNRKEKRIATS